MCFSLEEVPEPVDKVLPVETVPVGVGVMERRVVTE